MTNRLISALTVAALMIAAAFTLKTVERAGWLDAETAKRVVQVLIGLGLAAYGNLMPKQVGPLRRSLVAQARIQTSLRVGGWAFALAGLAYAGLWAFAPLAFADTASMLAVMAAVAVTLGYVAWRLARRFAPRAG